MSYWDDLKSLMQTHGKQAVSAALGNSPLADVINNAPDLFNEAATSPTGQAVAKGLTGAPLTDLVPNPGNPVAGAAEGLIAPSMEDAVTPDAPTPMQASPSVPEPISVAPSPDSGPTDDSVASSDDNSGSAKPTPKGNLDSIIDTADNDNNARLANDAALDKRKKLNIIPEALANAADAVAGSASAFGANVSQGHGAKQKESDEADIEKQKGEFESGLKQDPNSDISKQYQGLLAKFLQKDPSDPMIQGRSAEQIVGQIPAIEKLAAMQNQKDMKDLQLKTLQANKEIALGQKHDSEQDRLENGAIQRLSSLRGDKSLQDAEAKRDAAITVYNTIDKLQQKGEMPSKLVYYDLLGQMWKARTGTAPTNEAIRDLDQKTFKGDINKAVTFFTGKATGGTTQSILQNIKDFAKDSGDAADLFHSQYMKAHLIKPTGLDDSRWQNIAGTNRGISFADATKANAQQSVPVSKTINGKTYIQKNGKWFQQ
ncbi:MAG: hypothetical protein V4440_13900 [Pseudomonadota bacterium]